jgi:hypothetical protein
MRSGTNHIEPGGQSVPPIMRHSLSRDVIHRSKTSPVDLQTAPVPSEVRETAKNLRELLLWDLRADGYTFDEIGALFGITKQRVSQIERKMILRATARSLPGTGRQILKSRHDAIRCIYRMRMQRITKEEFANRLDAINSAYQAKFDRILERKYKRQFFVRCSGTYETTEFWKLWPLIERYHRKPFSFSQLIADFPQLAHQSHVPQLLCRLRRTALLQRVGLVKVRGHNLPEVLMAEAPIEEQVAATIERMVLSWSRKLLGLQSAYRPTRQSGSIEMIRRGLAKRLLAEGISRNEIERVLYWSSTKSAC